MTYDILFLILGAILGSFGSWIVTYEFERIKKNGTETLESIADGKINIDIETCWRKITDNRNMPYFTIGFWDEFQDLDDEIGPGTVIKRTGYMGSERRIFVNIYDKPYRFAWGSDRYNWDDFIELKKMGKIHKYF